MNSRCYDVAVIGGGIVGMSTAMALTERFHLSLIVLEKEERLAVHQSGNSSGVIHSGVYYKPRSLKAQYCIEGREALVRFCEGHGIPFRRCGNVIVAVHERELLVLEELIQRGEANGLQGLKRLRTEEIHEFEPYAGGIAGLWVPQTGVVDYTQVTYAYANLVQKSRGVVQTGARLYGFRRYPGEFLLETTKGEVLCHNLINCGGLQSDRIARMCGVDPGIQIIPFRGEYYSLNPECQNLIRNLIFPVPEPNLPFLGAHFTRRIEGKVEVGPNAVLALKREGYHPWSFSGVDSLQIALYIGFWRMARNHWRRGVGEFYRSVRKRAFWKSLKRLIPELGIDDIQWKRAGIRAQAVEPTGLLVDDFRVIHGERMVHVLNAPSPAATASIMIGRAIARMAGENFGLRGK